VGLDWEEHTVIDRSLYRPTEIALGKDNPAKAKEKLAWEAKDKMHDVVKMMVEAKQDKLSAIWKNKKIQDLSPLILLYLGSIYAKIGLTCRLGGGEVFNVSPERYRLKGEGDLGNSFLIW